MNFGMFDHMERRGDADLTQQYEDRFKLLEVADAAGVHAYHVAEHHHSPLCLAPNQSVYLAAVAQRTKRIKIGTLVYVLPLHHPVRLIEEICMLDWLSGGRAQVGVGRGTGGGTEFAMWNGDASENDGRFEETLEILLQGLQSDFLTYEGKYFDYHNLWMELRPAQQPHPPFWYAGNPVHAGERGMNFIASAHGGGEGLARDMAQYVEAWKRSQANPGPGIGRLTEPLYGVHKHVLLADTDDEARERVLSAYQSYRSHFAKPLPEGVERQPTGRPGRFANEGSVLENEAFLVGSPRTVRESLQRYAADSGANYFVSSFHWGDLTHAEAYHSLELFAGEVMPALVAANE